MPQATPVATRAKAPPPRRTVVRVAITLLVQYPELAEGLAPPWAFAGLRQQGVPLLIELLELIRARPGIRPGPLLDHFAGREEEAALRRLSVAEFLIHDKAARAEFEGALAQLARQSQAERREALLEIQRTRPLNDAEKDELRELLRARTAGD